MNTAPIGMLDSGVGGLSILREVRRQLPNEDLLYFADQGHVPYGPRSDDQIRAFVHAITAFFLQRNAKAVVVACNTASAAALYPLRASFPAVPFVGMEPAVKPAVLGTRSGVIGVISTEVTSQGALFASVVDRFAQDVEVITQVCPDFVTLVEAGQRDSEQARHAAQTYLQPLLDAGIDQLVLGCTHFPFLAPVLRQVAGDGVKIVDPSAAVARQVGRVIRAQRNHPTHNGRVTYFTSGDPAAFRRVAADLLGHPIPKPDVVGVQWVNGGVVPAAVST